MTSSEDVLLKEVDEDLKVDQQLNFLKQYGPWVAGAAALVVAGVGFQQFSSAQKAAAMETEAEAFSAALLERENDILTSADALDQLSGQLGSGYKGLAGLREAALRAASGQSEEAIAVYRSVYQDGQLPDRLRDLARVRAGYLMVDIDAPSASAIADEVTTPAFIDNAQEVKAMAALTTGGYDEAYTLLSALSAKAGSPSVAARARTLLPVADAARNGVALEVETSETDAFLQSFTEQLGLDAAASVETETPPDEAVSPE